MKVKFQYIWYLSAIEIIDTQVARRGRQYHRNPPPYKNCPTKKNRIYKIQNHNTAHTPLPKKPPLQKKTVSTKKKTHTTPHHHRQTHTTPPNPTQAYKKNRPTKK